MRSFDENTFVSDECHNQLSRNEMPCQAVFNKMSLDPIPDEIKDFKQLEKKFTSKRIIFKRNTVMHGKQEFAESKGSICNIPIETANIFNILPRPTDSNELIVVKLKRDLNYRGYVYFEPVRADTIYQALNYLKTINSMMIFPFQKASHAINDFSRFDKHQDVAENIHTEIILNETEYGSVEDPLSMHKTGSNETALVSQIPSIINDENVTIAQRQGK